jgi:hypothetical protein
VVVHVDRLHHRLGALDGAVGVVGARERSAEHGHDAVADEFVDDPLVSSDRVE